MARHRDTDKTKQLRGTARPDRASTAAPDYGKLAVAPEPPEHLSDYGKEVWKTCTIELVENKLLAVTDLVLLEVLVSAVSDYHEACEKLKGRSKITMGASKTCLLYTSPSPRDLSTSRMPSSA